MAQIKNPLDEVRIPFNKMTFTPDVPSTQLQPNEYNDGQNVETDVVVYAVWQAMRKY